MFHEGTRKWTGVRSITIGQHSAKCGTKWKPHHSMVWSPQSQQICSSSNPQAITILLFFFQNFLGEIGTQEFTFSMSGAEELWASPWMQFWWSDPSLRHASKAPCYHQYSTPICLIIGLCQLASDHQREATVLGSARELGVAVWKQAQEDHSPV